MNFYEYRYRGCDANAIALDDALDVVLPILREERDFGIAFDGIPEFKEDEHPREKEGQEGGGRFAEKSDKSDEIDNLGTPVPTETQKPKGFLSNKKREEYSRLMAKKHPGLDADAILSELAKIQDKTLQGDAFRWVVKGAAKIPEDLPKIELARKIATKAKVDPFKYDTPQECVNAHSEFDKGEGRMIDPDDVPELSDKKDMGHGVTTYLVQDDEAGQKAMRKILNSHYGKNEDGHYFSPWCLLHDDGHGGLSKDAKGYWEHYNALPKRVAFKDGKVVAFMATAKGLGWKERAEKLYPEYVKEAEKKGLHPKDKEGFLADYAKQTKATDKVAEEWWDLDDNPHRGIPLSYKDKSGRDIKSELIDGKEKIFSITQGEKGEAGYTDWWPEKPEQKQYEKGENGESRSWHSNGTLRHKRDMDGVVKHYDENGKELHAREKDGTERDWFSNGQMSHEELPDGTYRRWYDNGQKAEAVLPDGTRREWYDSGQMAEEVLPDGTTRGWSPFGQKEYEKLPDGTERMWHENGQMQNEKLPDGNIRGWYDNGQLQYEKLPDCPERKWDEDGKRIK